ncbi:MAG: hypothetical protein ACRDD8_11240 [Bacteroidales bacterium]
MKAKKIFESEDIASIINTLDLIEGGEEVNQAEDVTSADGPVNLPDGVYPAKIKGYLCKIENPKDPSDIISFKMNSVGVRGRCAAEVVIKNKMATVYLK